MEKSIKRILITKEISKKHPLVERVIMETYHDVKIVTDKSVHFFISECIKDGECFAIVSVNNLLIDVFSDVKYLIKRLDNTNIKKFFLLEPAIHNDDIGFDETISHITEIKIVPTEKNEFHAKYSEKKVKQQGKPADEFSK